MQPSGRQPYSQCSGYQQDQKKEKNIDSHHDNQTIMFHEKSKLNKLVVRKKYSDEEFLWVCVRTQTFGYEFKSDRSQLLLLIPWVASQGFIQKAVLSPS